jgi:hypothetical protein
MSDRLSMVKKTREQLSAKMRYSDETAWISSSTCGHAAVSDRATTFASPSAMRTVSASLILTEMSADSFLRFSSDESTLSSSRMLP